MKYKQVYQSIPKYNNKRGQINGVVFFIVLLIVMITLAPIILKVAVTIMDKTSVQLANPNIDVTNRSARLVGFTRDKLVSSFDWAIMLIVIFDMFLLLVTAFLVDIHPAFLVIYIIAMFVLVLTIPYSVTAAEKIYSMSEFSGANGVTQYIPMTEFMLNNFGMLIVGVIVLTGIIMYAKIKFSSNNQGGTY